jgi:hypothetical protein
MGIGNALHATHPVCAFFTSNAACSPSDFGPIRRPSLSDSVGNRPVLNEAAEIQALV